MKKTAFQEFYDSLSASERVRIRNLICVECDISPFYFYNKKKNDSFSKLERERISQLTGCNITATDKAA
jgi:hypothetical protein